ncbi:MAG TPA: hypothetical protein VJN64_17690 [Terriglobales bacterium]|nr:hypothetical protein [Terriglobales bacterium]
MAWVLLLAAVTLSPAGESAHDRGDVRPPKAANAPEPSYKIQAGIDGEIYPVFANYASLQAESERSFGTVSVTVTNPTSSDLHQRMEVSILGWSDQEIQIAELPAGASHTFLFAPSFLPRFYRNQEITAASVKVTVSDSSGRTAFESTFPVRLRSAEDMYWGPAFKYAPFIASWVTPHAPQVEALLAKAKQFTPDRRLPGYESWKSPDQQEEETYLEAKAIFDALKQSGLSYVKSSLTLGDHKSMSERVRLPKATLAQSSGNCIDAVVAYASLFENLGMQPAVVLVPGHAYVGVRSAQDGKDFLFVDAALTGRTTFEAAVSAARAGLERNVPATMRQINIQGARSAGIYPMP